MKKRRILLALLALALAVTTVLPAAMAYFSTNARTDGHLTLKLGGTTTIDETFANMVKTVTIAATGEAQPMWVRARAYVAAPFTVTYEASEGWTVDDDGWYYYEKPLASYTSPLPDWLTDEADPLKVTIHAEGIEPEDLPEGFEVPVVYQTTPVQYNEDGTPKEMTTEALWSVPVKTPQSANPSEGGSAE